jgi:hypothetical protein
MKSYGGLFAAVVARRNVEVATDRAARGKRDRPAVQRFLAARDANIGQLVEDLAEGVYRPGPYRQFGILDPKPRLISCADFRDRIVHHAICRILGPLIDGRMIADSYACRDGKGAHRALLRARDFSRRFSWTLKADIRRYFDSVDHEALLRRLERLVREPALRALLAAIVRHPFPGQAPGKGLPIGNLTSQWFANLYLDELDHWAKEARRIPGYVRYMDDIACWAESKDALFAFAAEMRAFLAERLQLNLKEDRLVIAPVTEGMPFLGWRVYPGLLRQQGTRLRRQRRLIARRELEYLRGEISAETLQDSVRAVVGTRRFLGCGEPVRSLVDA